MCISREELCILIVVLTHFKISNSQFIQISLTCFFVILQKIIILLADVI